MPEVDRTLWRDARDKVARLGRTLKDELPPDAGFVLIVAQLGPRDSAMQLNVSSMNAASAAAACTDAAEFFNTPAALHRTPYAPPQVRP